MYTNKNKYTLVQSGEEKKDGTIPAFKCYIKVFKNAIFDCMSNNSTDCTDKSVNLNFTKQGLTGDRTRIEGFKVPSDAITP